MSDNTISEIEPSLDEETAFAPIIRKPEKVVPTQKIQKTHDTTEDNTNTLDASGLYVNQQQNSKEQCRLDVDGRYPQMQASGRLSYGLRNRVDWLAQLQQHEANRYSGTIWYTDGNTQDFPYNTVDITVTRSRFAEQRAIQVTFSGGRVQELQQRYRFDSRFFHSVEFEFDRVSDVAADSAVMAIETCAHPNRPASIQCENLSIKNVFQRAGFHVSKTKEDGVIAIDGAGRNARWNNAELHDAMQIYWSRFANRPQWSTWVMFAGLHEQPYGGIMFDNIGRYQRQGSAIFENSPIAMPPLREKNPSAWVARNRFYTACHEMGHSFNLAHSWQKQLGRSWLRTRNEPEARSFMNYPDMVRGNSNAFFADFNYRFSDNELLFMRHAPSQFVQMGNATWFDNHGFEQADQLPFSQLNIQLTANRTEARYEFLEPVILELKLSNLSYEPVLVDKNILSSTDRMTVIIKKENKSAREWQSFVRYLQFPEKIVLNPGESIYDSLFVSAGINGWDITEPGNYTVQMILNCNDQDLVSNVIRLRVLPSQSYDAECCAQDVFSDEVARILALNGSRVLNSGIDALHDVVDRLPNSMAARHAKVALVLPQTRDYKTLTEKKGEKVINTIVAKVDDVKDSLNMAFITDSNAIAQTLGHVEYKKLMDNCVLFFKQQGDDATATKYYNACFKTLTSRGVPASIFDHPINESRSSKKKLKDKKITDEIT